jgi:hypothetical protein
MSWRSWFTENPPPLRPKLPRQPQKLAQPHAEASAAAAASFKSAWLLASGRMPRQEKFDAWAFFNADPDFRAQIELNEGVGLKS